MFTRKGLMLLSVVSAVAFGLVGCRGMDRREHNTMLGAGVGAVGGAVLTDGSPLGTIAGAAAGGIIGHEMTNDGDSRRSHRQDRRNYDEDSGRSSRRDRRDDEDSGRSHRRDRRDRSED